MRRFALVARGVRDVPGLAVAVAAALSLALVAGCARSDAPPAPASFAGDWVFWETGPDGKPLASPHCKVRFVQSGDRVTLAAEGLLHPWTASGRGVVTGRSLTFTWGGTSWHGQATLLLEAGDATMRGTYLKEHVRSEPQGILGRRAEAGGTPATAPAAAPVPG